MYLEFLILACTIYILAPNNEELVVNKVLLTLLICAFILGVSIFGAYILARPLFEVDSLGDRWMGTWYRYKIVQGNKVIYDNSSYEKRTNRSVLTLYKNRIGTWHHDLNEYQLAWKAEYTTCELRTNDNQTYGIYLWEDAIVCKQPDGSKEYYTRQEDFSTETRQ